MDAPPLAPLAVREGGQDWAARTGKWVFTLQTEAEQRLCRGFSIREVQTPRCQAWCLPPAPGAVAATRSAERCSAGFALGAQPVLCEVAAECAGYRVVAGACSPSAGCFLLPGIQPPWRLLLSSLSLNRDAGPTLLPAPGPAPAKDPPPPASAPHSLWRHLPAFRVTQTNHCERRPGKGHSSPPSSL